MTGNTPICSSFSGALPDTLLWIDGDSCPRNLRAILLRAIVRTGIAATFVADRSLPDVVQAMADHTATLRRQVKALFAGEGEARTQVEHIRKVRTPISMVVVQAGTDSADDYIVEHAEPQTLAVTHDVPLASRLVARDLVVLDDRGGCFTSENIGERLSLRNAMTELREMGIFAEQGKSFGPAEIKAFADALDRQLVELLRRFPEGQVAARPERMLLS
jgi:uncharacterized protein YaiI (UPF0178 family)